MTGLPKKSNFLYYSYIIIQYKKIDWLEKKNLDISNNICKCLNLHDFKKALVFQKN